jgi:hypothetical protein
MREFCPEGHKLTLENTYFAPAGKQRRCIQCNNEASKSFNDRFKEKLGEEVRFTKNYLPKEMVANIKHMKGSIGAVELAKMYKIYPGRIYKIWNGTLWKNL